MIIRLTTVYKSVWWSKKYITGYKFQKWVNGHWEDYDETK